MLAAKSSDLIIVSYRKLPFLITLGVKGTAARICLAGTRQRLAFAQIIES
jgi:hypothetical protein